MIADNGLLDPSMCPACSDLEECVYFEYAYRCRCRAGYAMTVNYQTGYLANQPRMPDPGRLIECSDVDECR